MDTAQQALFREMLNEGWFTDSDGHVESPTGYFGYVTNLPAELAEVREAFEDTLDVYGPVADDGLIGSWVAQINNQGIIAIQPAESDQAAREWFETVQADYIAWENAA